MTFTADSIPVHASECNENPGARKVISVSTGAPRSAGCYTRAACVRLAEPLIAMPLLISFLRGINVGGHKKIKMADLRGLYSLNWALRIRARCCRAAMLFSRRRTQTWPRSAPVLRRASENNFGFEARALLRRPEAFRAALADHPFSAEQLDRGNHAMVVFLSGAPDEGAVAALRANNPGREVDFGHCGSALCLLHGWRRPLEAGYQAHRVVRWAWSPARATGIPASVC